MTSLAAHTARRRSGRLADLMGLANDAFGIGEKAVAPVLDLLVRLYLAQVFWVSGIVKVSNWESALFLAEHEYPVSWMDPVVAAYLGGTIEILGPIFLALGLATRFAALPMMVLALVIQYAYLAIPVHEFWAILLGWYVVMGAGPISLDRKLSRGFAETAVPLAKALNRLFQAFTRYVGPLYQVFLRVWLARIFFLSGLTKIRDFESTIFLFEYEYQTPLISPTLAAILGTTFELACPVLLVIGLATRLAVLLLIGMTLVIQFTYLQHIDHLFWIILAALILLHGPGPLSADHLIARTLRRVFPQLAGKPAFELAGLPHVVVVGAGFAGLSVSRGLRKAACRVTVIDRHNYHLFQPLLYQVATATLRPADIATPVRGLFRDQFNARVLLGRVTDIDTGRDQVALGEQRIGYDYLVLATGARHGYFGRDDAWEPLAPGLKKIEDAERVRQRLLVAFEMAENAEDAQVQRALLTFVIVGGGPTGVELAGAIAELARHGMEREFRNIDPAQARVLLVQSGPRLLPAFRERLSAVAEHSLTDLGVEVMTGNRVEEIDEEGVTVAGSRIESRTVFWAAGVIASPAAKWVEGEQDRAGRLKVEPDLSVRGHPNVFAVGDTALSQAWGGKAVPGLAPAAKQGGQYVAKLIRARLEGRPAPAPFRYRHVGSLATIGRKSAVVDFGWIGFTGAAAWWLWGALHVYFLVGVRNRVSVPSLPTSLRHRPPLELL